MFQLIRDRTLSGTVPLVLFNGFDASYGSKLSWLCYFLAPMQDGKFVYHGQMHTLGTAVFVFIGGTSSTFENFEGVPDSVSSGPPNVEFVAAKGPDFVSRLRGYVNVHGLDKVSNEDRMYPIRRAILLRALLEQRLPKKGHVLMIDDTVLDGLLTIGGFHHGARSLEAILAMSRLSGPTPSSAQPSPSEAHLNLLVDALDFMGRVRH